MSDTGCALLADVGGTNARFALWQNGEIRHVRFFSVADFDSLESACSWYVNGLPGVTFEQAAFAIAGRIDANDIPFTNAPWVLQRKSLCELLDIDCIHVLNDFEAAALGTLDTPDEYLAHVTGPKARPGTRAVLGPGTGLGVATLAWLGGDSYVALPGEGGHVTLAACTDAEEDLIRHVRHSVDHPVSAEDLVSGRGVLDLARACARQSGETMHYKRPADLFDAASSSAFARRVTDFFYAFLGTVSHNLVMTTGAEGGLYLAGGITAKNLELLKHSGFARRFVDHRVYGDWLATVPVYAVSDPELAFRGLGRALDRTSAAEASNVLPISRSVSPLS